MRPRPSEVVQGVRAVLKDVVAPAVQDDHARARLEECRIALAQVDWDDAGFRLAERNRTLANALKGARAWTGEVDLSLPAQATFDAHQVTYERLAGALVRALQALRRRLGDTPDDPDARATYEALLAVI